MRDIEWWEHFFANLFDKHHAHGPATPEKDFDKIEWDGGKCQRTCGLDEKPRICYYHWTLEYYHAMGP